MHFRSVSPSLGRYKRHCWEANHLLSGEPFKLGSYLMHKLHEDGVRVCGLESSWKARCWEKVSEDKFWRKEVGPVLGTACDQSLIPAYWATVRCWVLRLMPVFLWVQVGAKCWVLPYHCPTRNAHSCCLIRRALNAAIHPHSPLCLLL